MNSRVVHPNSEHSISPFRHASPIVYVAAGSTLLISLLPNIIWQETTKSSSDWLLWVKLAMIGLLILGSTIWKVLRPLRSYFVIFIVLYLAEWGSNLFGETPLWKSWFSDTSFIGNMLGIQLLRLLVAFVMVTALFIVKRRRSDFFLIVGQTDAPVGPVSWLGVNHSVSWSRFGLVAAICISLGTLAFLLIAGTPNIETMLKALPMLPVIVILALMNSFSEEVNYRASMIATLHGVVSNQQTILITAGFFGIGHFYGVPYGILGVAMAGVLGWLLGKAMLETKGFFWPWSIHFLQDVLIFSFMAIGSVVAGGK